jgi:hypothetical protein
VAVFAMIFAVAMNPITGMNKTLKKTFNHKKCRLVSFNF